MTARSEMNGWWRFALTLLDPVIRILFDVRTADLDRIPRSGPALLAANHPSALDGILLPYAVAREVRRPTRFLVAAEFFARPFHGFWLRRFQQIPIHRGRQDASALDQAVAAVRSGAIAGIFPEGTVNTRPDRPLLRGHTGIARIAFAVDAPVLPVGIWGTQLRWPKSGLTFRRPFRPTIAVAIGEAVRPIGHLDSSDDVQAFTDIAMASISEQVRIARSLAGCSP